MEGGLRRGRVGRGKDNTIRSRPNDSNGSNLLTRSPLPSTPLSAIFRAEGTKPLCLCGRLFFFQADALDMEPDFRTLRVRAPAVSFPPFDGLSGRVW